MSPCTTALLDWADGRNSDVMTGHAISWLWHLGQAVLPPWASASQWTNERMKSKDVERASSNTVLWPGNPKTQLRKTMLFRKVPQVFYVTDFLSGQEHKEMLYSPASREGISKVMKQRSLSNTFIFSWRNKQTKILKGTIPLKSLKLHTLTPSQLHPHPQVTLIG